MFIVLEGMGAYRSRPITEKVSESGEYYTVERKVIYGATAMQGWRMSMEVSVAAIARIKHDILGCTYTGCSLYCS